MATLSVRPLSRGGWGWGRHQEGHLPPAYLGPSPQWGLLATPAGHKCSPILGPVLRRPSIFLFPTPPFMSLTVLKLVAPAHDMVSICLTGHLSFQVPFQVLLPGRVFLPTVP